MAALDLRGNSPLRPIPRPSIVSNAVCKFLHETGLAVAGSRCVPASEFGVPFEWSRVGDPLTASQPIRTRNGRLPAGLTALTCFETGSWKSLWRVV
jgi:hypothetical protein